MGSKMLCLGVIKLKLATLKIHWTDLNWTGINWSALGFLFGLWCMKVATVSQGADHIIAVWVHQDTHCTALHKVHWGTFEYNWYMALSCVKGASWVVHSIPRCSSKMYSNKTVILETNTVIIDTSPVVFGTNRVQLRLDPAIVETSLIGYLSIVRLYPIKKYSLHHWIYQTRCSCTKAM